MPSSGDSCGRGANHNLGTNCGIFRGCCSTVPNDLLSDRPPVELAEYVHSLRFATAMTQSWATTLLCSLKPAEHRPPDISPLQSLENERIMGNIPHGDAGKSHAETLRLTTGGPSADDDFANNAQNRALTYRPSPAEVRLVNAALHLRRPMLVAGPPGSGKSSLAYAIAEELTLTPVLQWPINSRTTLADGLYRYDAIALGCETPILNRATPPLPVDLQK